MKKNVLVTGAAGYIGKLTIERLKQIKDVQGPIGNIVSMDIKDFPKEERQDGIEYLQQDIRAPVITDYLTSYSIDTVIHLASIVTPGKKSNREFEYSVDVLGTENILKACIAASVKRIIVTSSGAAYGYHKDNPVWLTEEDAIRGNEDFSYSYHKRLVEEMLGEYREKYPLLEQVVFRVGTILGETVNNQITALFHKRRLIKVRNSNSPFVFIWDRDVVEALIMAIHSNNTGIFNLAGGGTMTIDEIADNLGKKTVSFPPWVIKSLLFILKKTGLTGYGPEQVDFLRYRPVLSNEKLIKQFGYTPQKTTQEVFHFYKNSRHLSDS